MDQQTAQATTNLTTTMPYISTEQVKEIRNSLKQQMPDFKFSVRRSDHMAVEIALMSGPVDFGSTYAQINHFYIPEHWGDQPDACHALMMVQEIASKEQRIVARDTDYGDWPNFYVRISIGKWDKPYFVN